MEIPRTRYDVKDTVTIRPWSEGDSHGIWAVIQNAASSQVWPGFLLLVGRRYFQLPAIILSTLVYLYYRSSFTVVNLYTTPEWLFIYILAGLILMAYISQWIIAGYYLYGPTLNDLKDIENIYFGDRGSHFWVAETEGKIVGTIAIVRKNENEAWLRRMAVLTSYRNNQIASKLLQTAIDFSICQSYGKISLITTDIHLPARNLYRKFGFSCTVYEPRFYCWGMVPVWTYSFEKELFFD